MAHVQAEVEKPPLSAAGSPRPPNRGQLPRITEGRAAAGGPRNTTQGVDPAKLNPRIHCRGTHQQEWLTPIHRAGPAVIADIRHIHNRTGPYCTFRSYGPVQTAPTLPAAA